MARYVDRASPVNWSHPLNRGLTAWWLHLPGENRAFNVVHLFDGRLTATWPGSNSPTNGRGPGPLGGWGSWDCDGSANDYAKIPSGFTNLFSGQATHTLAFWVWARTFTGAPVIFSHGIADTFFFSEFSSGGALFWGSGTGGVYRTYSAPTVSTRTWAHLAFVKTATGDNGNLYVNGVLTTSFTGTLGTTETGSRDLWFGNYPTAGLGLDGRIADVRVYSTRALAADEVWSLYNESRLGHPTTLSWWGRRGAADVAAAAAAAPRRLLLLGVGA